MMGELPRRIGGRSFGRRVNCEQVPLLPASVVAWILDDPEEVPYVLVWKDSSGTVQESVHVAPHAETGVVEIKRGDGTPEIIDTLLRPLPRNGGSVRLLICPYCQIPRRRVVWMGAWRTVYLQRRAVNLGMPSLQSVALRVRGRRACTSCTWKAWADVRQYFRTQPL